MYVIDQDSTAELRPVKLGQRQDELVVVDEGLKPGERVVVDGRPGNARRQGPHRRATLHGEFASRDQGGRVMNFSEPFVRRPVMTAVLTVSVILFGCSATCGCR